jgi:hypothetical protein
MVNESDLCNESLLVRAFMRYVQYHEISVDTLVRVYVYVGVSTLISSRCNNPIETAFSGNKHTEERVVGVEDVRD